MTYQPTEAEVHAACESYSNSTGGYFWPYEDMMRVALIAAHNARQPPGEDTTVAHGAEVDVTADAEGRMRLVDPLIHSEQNSR